MNDHECCDGECNHDSCCGKIPENCLNKYDNFYGLTGNADQRFIRSQEIQKQMKAQGEDLDDYEPDYHNMPITNKE